MGSIYGLQDPRTGEIRYVGLTSLTPEERLHFHIVQACAPSAPITHKNNWIRELVALNLKPEVFVIQVCATREELSIAERFWIGKLRDAGCPLTNLGPGGEGYIPSTDLAARERFAAAQRRIYDGPLGKEIRRARGAGWRGKKQPQHMIDARAEANRRPHTAEERAAQSERRRGIKDTEETKQKKRESTRRRYDDPAEREAVGARMSEYWQREGNAEARANLAAKLTGRPLPANRFARERRDLKSVRTEDDLFIVNLALTHSLMQQLDDLLEVT